MGATSLAEDASERRDEDAHGRGGYVGPAGGGKVSPDVLPRKPGPLAAPKKDCTRVSLTKELEQVYARLRGATRFLGEMLDAMASDAGWQRLVQKSAIWAQWAQLSGEESEPRPSYDDYLSVQRAFDELEEVVTATVSVPEAAVFAAQSELKELRAKYEAPKPRYSQQDAERRAEGLLMICHRIKKQIEDAEAILCYLSFDSPAFRAHRDRYFDEKY